MTYHWIIPLIAAVLNAVLGAIVLRHNRRSPLNRVFALLSVTQLFWNLNIFVLYSFKDAESALYWSDVFRVGTLMASAVGSHLIVVFSETRSRRIWAALGGLYALSLFLVAANASGILVSGLRTYSWGFYPVGTHLYRLLPVSVALNLCLVIGVLIQVLLRSNSPRKRQQAKLWIAGAGIAMSLGMTNLIATFGVPFYPLGNLANVVYVGIIAYGIVRHRLMDIDLVVTKGMAYAAVSLVLIGPAFGLTLWLQQLSFKHIHPDFSAGILLMLIAVGVLFPTLRLQAEFRIGRSLFREKHEYRAALSAFTRSIVRILDREKLMRELAYTLAESLGLDQITISLYDEIKRVYSVRHGIGAFDPTEEYSEKHELMASLRTRHAAVLRDELEASTDPTEQTVVLEVFRRNGWEVCIPLSGSGQLIGFIALGRKRNLDAFFAEDLDLLETLAAEASVALENARLYEELKKSQDIIRRSDRLSALGTLAAGIAHEVRNPLVSIQTFFQLAPDRLHDEEFFTTFLSMTANEVKRISDLISELLSFARSPSPSLGRVDLNELLDRVATLLEPEARKHKLTITRAFDPSAPLIHADGDQIKQVVINLLLNAIQATQPGGTVCVTSRSIAHGAVDLAQIEIRDTGIGIPKDQLDSIFNPFFTTKDKGTGLGLAIANQIISEHGGSVSVDSKPGKGTTFTVNLPTWVDPPEAEQPAVQATETTHQVLRYERVRKVAS
jgi:two-component system, NtrC family, sensor kinase